MHWPTGFGKPDADEIVPRHPDGSVKYTDVHYKDTWKAMESLVDEGFVKHIGLSNFNSQQINEVLYFRYIKLNRLNI